LRAGTKKIFDARTTRSYKELSGRICSAFIAPLSFRCRKSGFALGKRVTHEALDFQKGVGGE
jgi:hypothetical protein